MTYIVDGYNVIGKLRKIDLGDRQKEDRLISTLENCEHFKKNRIALIFDSKACVGI